MHKRGSACFNSAGSPCEVLLSDHSCLCWRQVRVGDEADLDKSMPSGVVAAGYEVLIVSCSNLADTAEVEVPKTVVFFTVSADMPSLIGAHKAMGVDYASVWFRVLQGGVENFDRCLGLDCPIDWSEDFGTWCCKGWKGGLQSGAAGKRLCGV